MQKQLSIIICSLLVSLVFGTSLAQEREYILGKVIDAETKEPLAFVSIRIKDRALGIISNTDGSFKIPIKYKEYGDIIEISSMGYQKKEILLIDLALNSFNTIYMVPAVLELTEAVVQGKTKRSKRLSAAQVVKRAIKAIPENYPSRTFSSIGYYRDYQIKKEKYVNLNEAILEVIDSGFDQHDLPTTKVRIYDYQSNEDFEKDIDGRYKYDYKKYKKYIDKAYLFDYGGNEFTILRIHDAIRNFEHNSFDFVNVMKRDFVGNQYFKKEEEINLDDEILYVVSFNKIFTKYRVRGRIYISKKDFAIHKINYTLYDKTRTTENKEVDENGIDNVILVKIITEYTRGYNKMFPNYISFFNTFLVSKPPKFVLVETLVDKECECFMLTFNNNVDQLYAKQTKNYNFEFEGEKIKIDKIRIERDREHVVLIYPKMSRNEFLKIANELNVAARKNLELNEVFTIELTGLRDATEFSNLINKMQYISFRQFREFFVQEIKPNGSVLKDTLFMKKNVPIFKDQPIVKPDNFDDYWMNTPLKKVN